MRQFFKCSHLFDDALHVYHEIRNSSPRTSSITSCLGGALGAAHAIAIHDDGVQVYATSSNPFRMTVISSLENEILT